MPLAPSAARLFTAVVMDAVGCAIHAASLPHAVAVRRALASAGDHGEHVIWGTSTRAAAYDAVLANAADVHGFDFDDQCLGAGLHAGSAVVPVALALAGVRRISGDEMLRAMAIGAEIGGRVGRAIGDRAGRAGLHIHGWTGAIAAATTSGLLMNLDARALALAINEAALLGAGLLVAQRAGDVKRLHAGRAAQAGLIAGARASIRTTPSSSSGLDALLAAVDARHAPSTWSATALSIGEVLGFKLIPGKVQLQTAAAALADVIRGRRIAADDVARIDVGVDDYSARTVGAERTPVDAMSAQSSLAYVIARLVLSGSVDEGSFTIASVTDPAARALSARVFVHADRHVPAWGARVILRMRDGREIEARCDRAPGSPGGTPAGAMLDEKFRRLASVALPVAQVHQLENEIRSLPKSTDIRPLLADLGAAPSNATRSPSRGNRFTAKHGTSAPPPQLLPRALSHGHSAQLRILEQAASAPSPRSPAVAARIAALVRAVDGPGDDAVARAAGTRAVDVLRAHAAGAAPRRGLDAFAPEISVAAMSSAAHALRLDAAQSEAALSIALSIAPPLLSRRHGRMTFARSVEAGVLAARLAAAGFAGFADPIDREDGYTDVLFDRR